MQPMLKLIAPLKMTLICRECNFEIDRDDDNPQHELTNHYDKLHINSFVRGNICLQRLYSGYRFKDKCINRRIFVALQVHSYIDYININNSVNNDKDDVDDLDKTLNELKNNIKEGLKDYIRTNFTQL